MTQFVTMLGQSLYDTVTGGGGYPELTTHILGVYMITLLILFGNFLIKDRARLRKQREAAKAGGKRPKAE